ncbi:MAG: hypothetical protein WKF51_08915 [Geodermatophilaceae bacterium]
MTFRKRGRCDNGLDATAFRALRDVDPRVGEHLLDVLREAGIAAYLDPTSDVDAVTRSIALPSPPSDRLSVDRSLTAEATSLIEAHLDADESDGPHPGATRESGAPGSAAPSPSAHVTWSPVEEGPWQELIATYEKDHGRLGDTLTEDFDQAAQQNAERLTVAEQEARAAADAADEEHYEPPPLPPLPVLSRIAAYALVLLAGGVVLLVAPGVVGLNAQIGFVFGVLGIASGVGMLIWRMREGPRYEDPEDGAIV